MGRASTRLAIGLISAVTVAAACGRGSDDRDPAATAAPATKDGGHAGPDVEESLAQIVATVARINGSVEIRRRGMDDWQRAEVGAVLREGDWIRTAAKATAGIRFSKGGIIEVEDDSSIEIDLAEAGEAAGGVVVALERGSVVGSVDESTDREQPLLVRDADGTETRLSAEGKDKAEFRLRRSEKGTQISVRRGRINARRKGVATAIDKGQAVDVTSEGVGDVIALIAFPSSIKPGIDARFRHRDDLSVELAWKKVKGATGYRVQIARDLAFHDLVVTTTVAGTGFAFRPPAPGTYVWRVASVGAGDLAGEYGFARRIYGEVDAPADLLVAPPDQHIVAYSKNGKPPTVTFSWQSAGDVARYRLVLRDAGSPDGEPVLSRLTEQQSIEVPVKAGRYMWGVYAAGKQDRPLFVAGRKLLVEKRKAPRANTKDLWD